MSSDGPEIYQHPDPQTLDFQPEESSDSYRRPRENGAVIRPAGRFTYFVRLTDSDESHETRIAHDGNDFTGLCHCKGFLYSDEGKPCAHLWALHNADQHGTIEIKDVSDALTGTIYCPMCGEVVTEQ